MSGHAPETTPLIVLAGGKGTRLAAFEPNRPKPMVLVKDQPFLYWLISHYTGLGFRDFILSTGHKAEIIESFPWKSEFPPNRFRFERENEPLGTGGAILAIFKKLGLDEAWVINGDTFLPQALPEPKAGLEALYTALKSSEIFDAMPNLAVQSDLVVAEKPGGQYFDGGAIFVRREALERFTGKAPCSIHQCLAPAMEAQRVGYTIVDGTCYDIGTPERYRRFEKYLETVIHA